ncbi:Serine/threonine-protein kinase, partial [Podochytrium sp. JEL0797]
MGAAASQLAAAPPLSSSNSAAVFVAELLDELGISYERSLGTSRFLKTIKCKHATDGTALVAKAFMKPLVQVSNTNSPTPDDSNTTLLQLKHVIRLIMAESEILMHIPNAFPYLNVIETAKAGYMIRQYLYSNLYDRISYKPVYLPEDNPADFNFFFDSSSRRSCYVAPERFLAPGETLFHIKRPELTAEMDVFAIGCTIAEMFMEGTPLFTLSQLLRYRRGEFDPVVVLEKIDDVHVR